MMRTSELLMINPLGFGYNSETAVNNSFQNNISGNSEAAALREFSDFVHLLRQNHLSVTVIDAPGGASTPDAIFPNNWISFHEDDSVFLYPMFAPNRRAERDALIVQALSEEFEIGNIHDLTYFEAGEQYLEGTGSLVLDREHKVAYASISPRTSEELVLHFCELAGYRPVVFHAMESNGSAIYHTNVLMCLTENVAIVCLDVIPSLEERRELELSLSATGKQLVSLTTRQLHNFCGNMLAVQSSKNEHLLIMSSRSYQSLTTGQLAVLEKSNRIIHSSLDIIEQCGGGSARCMIAEIFNMRKKEPEVKTPGVVL